MKLFWFETKKIWSKKIAIFGLIFAFAWFLLYFAVTTLGYTCEDNGVYLRGKDAVIKNQEIAAEYAGPMTMEKAQAIIDKYGFSVYVTLYNNEYYRNGNCCSQWVTDYMSPYTETYEYSADELSFYTGEKTNNFEQYLDPNLVFSYQDGWRDLISLLRMMFGMLNFVVIIAISNVFTEEYSMHTAPILLTSTHGKSKGILMKILASFAFSFVCFLLVTGVIIISYMSFYGPQGLEGSAVFSDLIDPHVIDLFGTTLGGIFAETLLFGLVSILTSTCITLAISAICKQPFSSILINLGLFILPFLYCKLIAPFFPEGAFVNLTKAAANRLPIYLPESRLGSNVVVASLFILIVCISSIVLGYYKYKSYQETS